MVQVVHWHYPLYNLLDNQQPLPNKLYLISPILDATLSNKDISDALIEQDAVLSQFGVNEIMKNGRMAYH